MGHFLAGGNRIGRAYNMMCKNHYRSKIIPGFLAVDLEKLIDRNEKLSGPVTRMSFLSRFRCRKLREINLRWRQSNHEGRIGWFRFTKEIDLCIISLMVLCFPLNAARTQMTQRKHVQHKEVVKGLTSEGHQKAGELRRTHDCWYRRCQRGWKSF